jgi:hypothetical protein
MKLVKRVPLPTTRGNEFPRYELRRIMYVDNLIRSPLFGSPPFGNRHARASGHPQPWCWTPAFAGVTDRAAGGLALVEWLLGLHTL